MLLVLNLAVPFKYYTFKKANNKGTDQISQMRSLVCTFVARMQQK